MRVLCPSLLVVALGLLLAPAYAQDDAEIKLLPTDPDISVTYECVSRDANAMPATVEQLRAIPGVQVGLFGHIDNCMSMWLVQGSAAFQPSTLMGSFSRRLLPLQVPALPPPLFRAAAAAAATPVLRLVATMCLTYSRCDT